MLHSLFPSLLLFIITSYSQASNSIRIVPVDTTSEPDNVSLTIQYPHDNELKNALPILLQIRVEGYPLGIETETPRRKEIRASDKGQTIRVVIDDQPYILLNEDNAPTDAFDNHDAYFRASVETHIKNNIAPGDHLIRTYPAYSYGEAVRGDGSFSASVFSYKKQGITKIDLNAPMITYNEPQGAFKGNQPILLDFLCHNVRLSEDGYKISLMIDGKEIKKITQNQPYYIYGLSTGSHNIKLQLLNSVNKPVVNAFTGPSRTISIR